jgi:hypothetical protein
MRSRPVRRQKPIEIGTALAIAGIVIASCATVESPLGPIGDASAPGTVPAKGAATVTVGESDNPYSGVRATSVDIDCPSVTIRTGAAAWQISAGSGPTNVRYQGSLGQLARECAVLGDVMTMRVGVEGRLLVGPKGGAGSVNVPLRIALVAEGPQPKPIWSKFYSVPVTVPPNASQAIFSQVEDDLTFPLPANRKVDNYIVYVGFDPQGAATASKTKSAPAKTTTTTKKASAPEAAPKQPSAPAKSSAPPAASRQQPQFEPPPSPPPGVFAPPPGQGG